MAIVLYKTNRSPSVADTIKVSGVAVDLTGSTVKLQMRAENSAVLKVDAAATIILATAGTVRYDWLAADVDTAADYVAWWRVTNASGLVQDTPEFQVKILDHASGAADLCSLADVRELMEIPQNDITRDTLILSLIPSASVSIMDYAEREFAPATASATRRFKVDPCRDLQYGRNYVAAGGLYAVDLSPYNSLRSTTLVQLHPEQAGITKTLTADYDYTLGVQPQYGVYSRIKLFGGLNVLSSTIAQRFGFAYLDITGAWGFPAVPADIKDLTAKVVKAWVSRDVSAFAFPVGQPNDPAQVIPGDYELPIWAKRALKKYRRSQYLVG